MTHVPTSLGCWITPSWLMWSNSCLRMGSRIHAQACYITCIINHYKNNLVNSNLFGSDIRSLSQTNILRKYWEHLLHMVVKMHHFWIMWKNQSVSPSDTRWMKIKHWLNCICHSPLYLQKSPPHTQSKHLGSSLKSCITHQLAQVESEQGCCWMMAFGGSMATGEIMQQQIAVKICVNGMHEKVWMPDGMGPEVGWKASWFLMVNEIAEMW